MATSTNNSHYETLGVSKNATAKEIKQAFRKLSLRTHPDLNKETHGCGTKFKQIANAHFVLSNPIERRKYDSQLSEMAMWKGGRNNNFRDGQSYYGGGNFARPYHGRRPKPGLHVAMETISNPRYILMGIFGFASMACLGAALGTVSSNRPEYHYYHEQPMVEAWKNPTTGQYEQPAPWDPIYQKMKPKLEMIPREKVKRRAR